MPVRSIWLAAVCAVAAIFGCVYTRFYDGVGLIILLVFFAYFLNLLKSGRSIYSPPSPTLVKRSPIREAAKALAWLVGAGAVVVLSAHFGSDTQLAVSISVTAAVAGLVGFILFLLNAVLALLSGRDQRT